jgi:hypothetical protein
MTKYLYLVVSLNRPKLIITIKICESVESQVYYPNSQVTQNFLSFLYQTYTEKIRDLPMLLFLWFQKADKVMTTR